MTTEDISVKLAEHEMELKHHSDRLDTLEKNNEILQDMATSLAVMSRDQKTLTDKVDSVIEKVDVLEQKPSKRWDTLITALITGLVGLALGVLLKGGI